LETIRNYAEINLDDLNILLEKSKRKIFSFFESTVGQKWQSLYDYKNPICIALCQGAAMHYYDKINGIKDFDIWFFYKYNKKHLPYRTVWSCDFENQKFGSHPEQKEYIGRGIDIILRSIKTDVGNNPIDTIYNYFEFEKTKTSKLLAQKAVVILEPENLFGKTIWYKGRIEKIS